MNNYIFKGNLLKLKKEGEYELVEHPGACAILLHNTTDNQLCLVKQYRKAIDQDLWEIPAGKIDPTDNSPIQTILRETYEETGILLSEYNLKYLGYIFTTPGFSNEVIHIFYYPLDNMQQNLKQIDINEINEIKFFNLRDILKMIKNNEIKDSKTLCSIILALSMNLLTI